VVEADGVRVVLEDEDRAEPVVLEVEHPEDVRVVEAVEGAELPLGRVAGLLPLLLGGGPGDEVLAGAADAVLEGGVAGEAVLEAGARVEEEFPEQVVADPPLPLRRADADPVHRLGDGPGDLGVDAGVAGRAAAGHGAGGEGGEDAVARPARIVGRAVGQADVEGGRAFEAEVEVGVGEEDEGLEERQPRGPRDVRAED